MYWPPNTIFLLFFGFVVFVGKNRYFLPLSSLKLLEAEIKLPFVGKFGLCSYYVQIVRNSRERKNRETIIMQCNSLAFLFKSKFSFINYFLFHFFVSSQL